MEKTGFTTGRIILFLAFMALFITSFELSEMYGYRFLLPVWIAALLLTWAMGVYMFVMQVRAHEKSPRVQTILTEALVVLLLGTSISWFIWEGKRSTSEGGIMEAAIIPDETITNVERISRGLIISILGFAGLASLAAVSLLRPRMNRWRIAVWMKVVSLALIALGLLLRWPKDDKETIRFGHLIHPRWLRDMKLQGRFRMPFLDTAFPEFMNALREIDTGIVIATIGTLVLTIILLREFVKQWLSARKAPASVNAGSDDGQAI